MRRFTQRLAHVKQAGRAAAVKYRSPLLSAQTDEPARICIWEEVVLQHHRHQVVLHHHRHQGHPEVMF